MKRVFLIALILLTMVGLFVANQTSLLAKSPAGDGSTSTAAAQSDAAARTMHTAGQLYETGQFAQAAHAYEQLVDQGFVDESLFYNLANAHFKQGDYGQAILYYRRAQQLAPRDPDIEANLALARSRAVDQLEIVEDSGLVSQIGHFMQGRFTLNELAMAALGVWIFLVALLLLRSATKSGCTWRSLLTYGLIVTGALLVAGLLAVVSSSYVADNRPEGVIVASEVEVTSGPGSQYATEFTLHNGAEVDLVETRGNWVRLALPGGEIEGWAPTSAVASVSG